MIDKTIHERIAQRKLTILKGFNEVSSDPIKSLAEVKSENSDNKIYSEDVVKGFISEAINKATNTSELLKAQEQLDCLQPIEAVDERGIRQTLYIEKGKKAMVGETRDWKGQKYIKQANGSWKREVVKPKMKIEEYVDEDTGEIVQYERPVNPPKAERTDSPSQERRERKAETKLQKLSEKVDEAKDRIAEVEDYLADLNHDRKQIHMDMEEEAGSMGLEAFEAQGLHNEYGKQLEEVGERIANANKTLKQYRNAFNVVDNNYNDACEKLYKGEDFDHLLSETEEVIKGHMDFAGRGDSGSGGAKSGLVKKQLTDSKGRQTTRWVKQGEDESGQEEKKQPEEEEESEPKGTKTTEDHAKETSSEDLKAYLEKNPDGEHAEHAKQELSGRGEEGAGDNVDDETVDYNNPDSVKFGLDAHEDKDAIIDFAITHGVPIGQAMKLHDSTKQDHSETHAVIDEAQNSLNALKDKTGHPDSNNGNLQDILNESMEDHYEAFDGDFDRFSDEMIQRFGDGEEVTDMLMEAEDYFDSKSGDSDGATDTGGYDEQLTDYAMGDLEEAVYDLFGTRLEDGIHIDDLDKIFEHSDVADPTGDSKTATVNSMDDRKNIIADFLEAQGVSVERPQGGKEPMEKQGRSDEPKENKDTANKENDAQKMAREDSEGDGQNQDYVNMQDMDIIESMGEHIWNRQGGEMDTNKLFDMYMTLRDRGLSEQDIETEMGKGQWDDGAMMSDEEKEDMKEEWDYALDAILGEDRKKSDQNKDDEQASSGNFDNGGDFFNAYYEISENAEDWDEFLGDVNDYIEENNLGMDSNQQEQEFDKLSPKHKAKLSSMMKDAYDSYNRYQN